MGLVKVSFSPQGGQNSIHNLPLFNTKWFVPPAGRRVSHILQWSAMLCAPYLDGVSLVTDLFNSPTLLPANSTGIFKAVRVKQGYFLSTQQVRLVLLQERPRTVVLDDPELLAPLVGAIAVEYIHLL